MTSRGRLVVLAGGPAGTALAPLVPSALLAHSHRGADLGPRHPHRAGGDHLAPCCFFEVAAHRGVGPEDCFVRRVHVVGSVGGGEVVNVGCVVRVCVHVSILLDGGASCQVFLTQCLQCDERHTLVFSRTVRLFVMSRLNIARRSAHCVAEGMRGVPAVRPVGRARGVAIGRSKRGRKGSVGRLCSERSETTTAQNSVEVMLTRLPYKGMHMP